MKTKIIYISGGEKFNMSDVRAAFETVRTALSLGPDTIMFGVPVDSDDAFDGAFANVEPVSDNVPEPIPEPVVDMPNVADADVANEQTATPKKRGRKKICEPTDTPIADNQTPDVEPVIPILSVLGDKKASEQPAAQNESETDIPSTPLESPQEPESDLSDDDTTISDDDALGTVTDSETDTNIVVTETHETFETDDGDTVEIHDIIAADVPDIPHEKTLEELLESIESLSEDEQVVEPEPDITDADVEQSDPAEDATLQQLATEFLENQDKIINTTKTGARGRISKLKNILPFKKAKHEDGGLMGDLFGWAGIAANDEEFSMPGFLDLTPKK